MSRPDPHPDMVGCFRYLPPLLPGQQRHDVGATFTCLECGRVYTREPHQWRAARDRVAPTRPPTVAH